MATATQEPKTRQAPPDPYAPVVLQDWEAEKALRAEERARKRPIQRKCLDQQVAADFEAKKPKYEFEVECTYGIPDPDTGELEQKTDKRKVVAQNENEAWAKFCDKIKHWPSPGAVERKITRLEQIN